MFFSLRFSLFDLGLIETVDYNPNDSTTSVSILWDVQMLLQNLVQQAGWLQRQTATPTNATGLDLLSHVCCNATSTTKSMNNTTTPTRTATAATTTTTSASNGRPTAIVEDDDYDDDDLTNTDLTADQCAEIVDYCLPQDCPHFDD